MEEKNHIKKSSIKLIKLWEELIKKVFKNLIKGLIITKGTYGVGKTMLVKKVL
jgi:tRNA A37 threonylcarbamoyladenosine biosynthesis protein TsaE